MIHHQQRLHSISVLGLFLLAALILGLRAQLARAQDVEETVSLSADAIIRLLRNEPGLLLQSKKALIKAASYQGRLLGPEDLSDEAVYTLIREDESTRVMVTHEIEDRRYVQAKPTRQELEQGVVADWRPARAAAKAPAREGEAPRAVNQEEVYWEDHERVAKPALDQGVVQQAPDPTFPEPPIDSVPLPSGPNELDLRRQLESAEVPPDAAPMPRTPRDDQSPAMFGTSFPNGPAPKSAGLPGAGSISLDPAGAFAAASSSMGSYAAGPLPPGLAAGGSLTSPSRAAVGRGGRFSGTTPVRPTSPPASPAPAEEIPQHRPNPYANVPSLYDLYAQYSSRTPRLARFGADIFLNGTGNLEELPMDLPVGPEYVLGPGDGLSIELFGGISERLQRVVDRTGRVALPEVGAVEVSGRNLGDVQRFVQSALRTQFRDVQADISLSRLRTVRVYVVGDVVRPGAYDVSSLSTPLNAVYQAGGPTARGSLRILRHYRGRLLLQQTDVYDLLLHGIRSGVEGLEPGDTILVPPLGAQVTVEGMVRRPAVYELNGEKNLAEILELAGGVLQSGMLRHVDVERVQAHLSRTMLRLDIPEDNDRESAAKALADFKVEDGDRIKISPILPYADKAVYLAGHVVRPGKFAYREGMKLTDIVTSYADLLPEPYKRHAEIVRLNAPDSRPSILSFNLEDALAGKDHDLMLRPFDTIRIFGRFDFEDPPVVRVSGEVRHPGDHLTNGATRLRDAIYLAGGTTRDAELGDAQVFHRQPDGKLEVIDVNLSQALAGGERDNILLEPKDQVVVHKNRRKTDPPAVKIEGEIVRPGKYPLGEGMTAAELVRLAGGLKRGAYTELADLTRYDIAGGTDVTGEHRTVPLTRALAGEPAGDLPLHDGDVLTVRQIAGWNDLGATITVKGEVVHAGAYGIKEGERLSSILARAGGFREDAYPYGAVFERAQVREIEERNRAQLLGELEQEGMVLKGAPAPEGDDKLLKDASVLQWKATVERLENTPPSGRLIIHISRDPKRWAGTAADLEVRAGDSIYIPKKPGTVIVDGAVFNPTAVAFRPGKNAGWYLRQAGGPSNAGNKKAIFVIRADGSVAGGAGGMFSANVESAQLFAGDTVVVPEKAFSGTTRWKTAFQLSQVVEAAAIAASVSRTF